MEWYQIIISSSNSSSISIIIIIILVITFMEGIYNYVHETNHVSRVYTRIYNFYYM
jgi:hypothetical protein